MCPQRLESLFPPVLWKAYNQTPLALKARFLRIPTPFVGLSGFPAFTIAVFRTFTVVRELLWYYCSSVCGSPTRHVWDLILSWLHTSYHLAAASFSLDMGYIFWWVLALSINGCSTASCDFGALAGGDVHMSYYAMLNWRPIFWLFLMSPFWSHLSLC